MMFKDLTLEQKKKLLREEYLRDGADEDIIAQGLISDTESQVTSRLETIFDYKDYTEVEV
jgi:hypothetical protein